MPNPRSKLLISLLLVLAVGCLIATIFLLNHSKRAAKKADTQDLPPTEFSEAQLCGPISLHTAARMLGIQIDRAQLLKVCPPSAQGVSMAKLADAAHKFGLNAKGYKMTWQDLTELDSPAVLHINPSHFVTVCPSQYASEKHPDDIRVFDSAKAPEWWSQEKLEKSWSRAALVIEAPPKTKHARGPRIMFDSLIHDLGDVRVPLNQKLNLQLHFENAGNETLTIGNIKTSCGCTKIAAPPKTLETGAKATIDVAVNLDDVRGPFNHTVAVQTNDKLTPLTEVVISGRTYNTLITTRRELLFNAIPRAGHASKSMLLKDPGDGSLKDSLTTASILPESLSDEKLPIHMKSLIASYDPNKHPQFQGKENDLVVEVQVAVSDSAPIGDFDATIEIVTKVPGSEHVRIPIRGVVVSSISVKPAALFFSYDTDKPVSKTVTLESRTGPTLDLNAVSVSNELPLKVAKQNTSGKTIELTVTCSPSSPPNNTAAGDILCSFADETVVIPVIIHSQPQQ
ncbi:MAG: DUF1573 domain-containing protein [Phycisphaerales bacterium]|nr:MAG: DUF1573 domain-containing protein [Phycisphaerales bacterium]